MTRNEIIERIEEIKEQFSVEAMKHVTCLSADIFHERNDEDLTNEITDDMQECVMGLSSLIAKYQEAMEMWVEELDKAPWDINTNDN